MTSLDWQSSTSEAFQKMKLKDQLKHTAKDVGSKSWSSAKNFSLIGGMYAGSECLIESVTFFLGFFFPIEYTSNEKEEGCLMEGMLGRGN